MPIGARRIGILRFRLILKLSPQADAHSHTVLEKGSGTVLHVEGGSIQEGLKCMFFAEGRGRGGQLAVYSVSVVGLFFEKKGTVVLFRVLIKESNRGINAYTYFAKWSKR